MSGTVDVKSVFGAHILRRVIDEANVELMCGRIGTQGQSPPPTRWHGPTCDSCIAADQFERGY